MQPAPASLRDSESPVRLQARAGSGARTRPAGQPLALALLAAWIWLGGSGSSRAVILWSDLGATLVHETGAGSSFLTGSAMDILGGAVKEDDTSTNALYFKFHVDPLSDVNTEEYFAALQLYDGDTERLAVGNSLKAWAYSAFNTDQTGDANKVFGDMDLRSAAPEPATLGTPLTYEFPARTRPIIASTGIVVSLTGFAWNARSARK